MEVEGLRTRFINHDGTLGRKIYLPFGSFFIRSSFPPPSFPLFFSFLCVNLILFWLSWLRFGNNLAISLHLLKWCRTVESPHMHKVSFELLGVKKKTQYMFFFHSIYVLTLLSSANRLNLNKYHINIFIETLKRETWF